MMAEEGADPTGLAPAADSYRNEGATVMFLAVDGVLAGLIAVADPIQPTTADAIRRLHGEGLRVILLTGDNRRTGEAVAARLGIDEGIADALPPAPAVTTNPPQPHGRHAPLPGAAVNHPPPPPPPTP